MTLVAMEREASIAALLTPGLEWAEIVKGVPVTPLSMLILWQCTTTTMAVGSGSGARTEWLRHHHLLLQHSLSSFANASVILRNLASAHLSHKRLAKMAIAAVANQNYKGGSGGVNAISDTFYGGQSSSSASGSPAMPLVALAQALYKAVVVVEVISLTVSMVPVN